VSSTPPPAEEPRRVRFDYPATSDGPGTPTPTQGFAHLNAAHADETLYGGAAGGGKTDWLLAEVVRELHRFPGTSAGLFRRSYPELSQPGGVIPRLLARVPAGAGAYNGTEHLWTFNNGTAPLPGLVGLAVGTPGSTLQLGYMHNDRDVARYLGSEYLLQAWDQLEQHTEFQYRELRGRLRVPRAVAEAGARPRSIATANPGGRGHAWIRSRWIDPAPPRVLWRPRATEEELRPGVRLFVPAKATDNPYLDPTYIDRLMALPPDRRRALLEGDWDVFAGQRFRQWRREVHVVDPERLPVPMGGARRAIGVDYGGTAPFAALWGAVLGLDLVVVYRELYIAGLTPTQQAEAVLRAEAPGERAPGRAAPLYIDPSTYARGPGQPTATTAPNLPPPGSIAYAYRAAGLAVYRANNARLAGWATIDEALTVRPDGWPRLVVYSTCVNLIRTLPALVRDEKNPDDVDTDGEDHAPDALRYLLLGLNVPRAGTAQRRPADAGALAERTIMAGIRRRAW